MRDIGSVIAVIAAALAIVAVSVFGLHDTSVLVSPPDVVAETFVRELGMSRYELARHYLARDVKAHTSVDDMRSSFEPVRQATGRPDQVETAPPPDAGDRARVLATLEGRRSTAAMYVDLIREAGVWKVATWPLDIVQRP
jgi:hypothetical protein